MAAPHPIWRPPFMSDSQIPDQWSPAIRWILAGIALFVFFLLAAEMFASERYKAGAVFSALFVITFFVAVKWEKLASLFRPNPSKLQYLTLQSSELSGAVLEMSWGSAWARWFASQYLATNDHKPATEQFVLNIATSVVLDALMDGKLTARGRPPGAIEYEEISKDAWRLAGLSVHPDIRSLWRIKVIPRNNVAPDRIKPLLEYDSITVNAQQFESLWPRHDRKIDAARNRLLKKAKEVGADPVEIAKLKDGRRLKW